MIDGALKALEEDYVFPKVAQKMAQAIRARQNRKEYEVTFDLSPWAGQTLRLRLASADNQGPLRAGVDDIRFERIGQ